MNTYTIFLRNESGDLIETGQIEAETIQDAIIKTKGVYDVVGKLEEEK